MANSSDSEGSSPSHFQQECSVSNRPGLRSSKSSVTTQAKQSKPTSAAAEKDALRRQKALEKHFAKAQQQAAASHSPVVSRDQGEAAQVLPTMLQSQEIQEDQPNWSPTIVQEQQEFQAVPFQEDYVLPTVQSPSEASQVPAKKHVPPSATFTPTAVGLRPQEPAQQGLPSGYR